MIRRAVPSNYVSYVCCVLFLLSLRLLRTFLRALRAGTLRWMETRLNSESPKCLADARQQKHVTKNDVHSSFGERDLTTSDYEMKKKCFQYETYFCKLAPWIRLEFGDFFSTVYMPPGELPG